MKTFLTTLSILLIATASHAQTYTVERVIDGDTIKLTNGERVHLIGIDTPESRDSDKAKRDSKRTGQDLETITKMGQEATEFVNNFELEGEEVRLEFDVQERDKYGRLLAYVHIRLGNMFEGEISDGGEISAGLAQMLRIKTFYYWEGEYLNLNASIIKAGYATPMTIPPNVKYADLFKKLYEEAREQKRGLWAEEPDLLLLDFNSKPEKIAIPMH